MSRLTDLEAKLSQVEKKIEAPFDHKKHKDETRAKIAFYVVKAYFLLIGLVIVGAPLYNQYVINNPALALPIVDLFSALSATLSAPFGFVVGHYFKGSE